MSTLSEEVKRRIQEIDKEQAFFEKKTSTDIERHIRVSKDNGNYRYYLVTPENRPAGKYLKRFERDIAGKLIQKDYEENMRQSLQKERMILVKLQAFYQAVDGHYFYGPEERIWSSLGEGRKQMAVPAIQDDESYIKKWLSEEYEKKAFSEDAPEYYTGSGIRVRSKTELIIAEMLEKKRHSVLL